VAPWSQTARAGLPEAPRLPLPSQRPGQGLARQVSRGPPTGLRPEGPALRGATTPLAHPKAFARFIAALQQHAWVVYAKPPFASAQQVVSYLGRSTIGWPSATIAWWRCTRPGGVALARLSSWQQVKVMTLSAGVYPALPAAYLAQWLGAHASLWDPRQSVPRRTLPASRQALSQPPPVLTAPVSAPELMRRLTGIDIERCPHCHQGRLAVIATLYPLCPLKTCPCHRTAMMRPCAADLPPFMPERCPAGRGPVRAQRAESLPDTPRWQVRSHAKMRPRSDLAPGDGQPGAGWHPSMPRRPRSGIPIPSRPGPSMQRLRPTNSIGSAPCWLYTRTWVFWA